MTRRQFLSVPAAAAAARPGFAQVAFPGVSYRQYNRCLPDYLRGLARRAYLARNAELAKLTTPGAIRERQAWARTTFWNLIGGMPERTPLNARTVGSFEREGYRVEKIIYESRPAFHIPALLYIPAGAKPPLPGVLFQMGHTLNGKAGDMYQRCCQGLVKLGFLVLAFDPMGQGERVYYPDAAYKRTRLQSSDAEHTTPGKQMLLFGDTATRMQVWDAIRSLDYLASHPLVDPKRLASTGQSGGGTQTMHLMAADERLATAVECAGNTENVACANFNPPGATDDAEQDFVYSGPIGFDRWDVFYPFAPKPVLILVSDHDHIGTYSSQYIANGWEEFQKLRKVYAVLGKPNHLAWADTALPHSLAFDSRMHVYNWMRLHLQGKSTPLEEEPPTAPEPDAALFVSESGNMVRSLHGETPFHLNRSSRVEQTDIPLDRLLRLDRPPADARARVLARTPARGCSIETLEIQSAANVWLPAALYLPHQADPSKPLVLALDPAGRTARFNEGELYQSLALRGYPVCVPDVRGLGDLTPEYPRGAAHYARSHEMEEDFAWGSLILGKPLLSQRVTDVLTLAAALRRHAAVSDKRLVLAASGKLTIPGLFATALDARIDQLYLAGGLASYRSIVDTEEYNTPFADFLPGVLLHTDLPRIAASLPPRRVVVGGATNAAGERMEVSAVRRLYPSAHIEVRARGPWDVDSLSL